MEMYTLTYLKWMTNCRDQGTLFNVMWQPGWEGSLGRMDTCVSMTKSLCYSPETITFLIDYTPVENKSLKEMKGRRSCLLFLPSFS